MKITAKELKASLKASTQKWRDVYEEVRAAERVLSPKMKTLAPILSVPYTGLGTPSVHINYSNNLEVSMTCRTFFDGWQMLYNLEACGEFGEIIRTHDDASQWSAGRSYWFADPDRQEHTLLLVRLYVDPTLEDDPVACKLVVTGYRQRDPEPVYSLECGGHV